MAEGENLMTHVESGDSEMQVPLLDPKSLPKDSQRSMQMMVQRMNNMFTFMADSRRESKQALEAVTALQSLGPQVNQISNAQSVLSSKVELLQKELQLFVLRAAQRGFDDWAQILSPRHPPWCHPVHILSHV